MPRISGIAQLLMSTDYVFYGNLSCYHLMVHLAFTVSLHSDFFPS